jgi:hypothetical protein
MFVVWTVAPPTPTAPVEGVIPPSPSMRCCSSPAPTMSWFGKYARVGGPARPRLPMSLHCTRDSFFFFLLGQGDIAAGQLLFHERLELLLACHRHTHVVELPCRPAHIIFVSEVTHIAEHARARASKPGAAGRVYVEEREKTKQCQDWWPCRCRGGTGVSTHAGRGGAARPTMNVHALKRTHLSTDCSVESTTHSPASSVLGKSMRSIFPSWVSSVGMSPAKGDQPQYLQVSSVHPTDKCSR